MELRFDDDRRGRAESLDGNILTFESDRAFAPGAPIRFEASPAGESRALEGRSVSSKRVAPEAFVVRMRFVNLTREDRRLLIAALVTSPER